MKVNSAMTATTAEDHREKRQCLDIMWPSVYNGLCRHSHHAFKNHQKSDNVSIYTALHGCDGLAWLCINTTSKPSKPFTSAVSMQLLDSADGTKLRMLRSEKEQPVSDHTEYHMWLCWWNHTGLVRPSVCPSSNHLLLRVWRAVRWSSFRTAALSQVKKNT